MTINKNVESLEEKRVERPDPKKMSLGELVYYISSEVSIISAKRYTMWMSHKTFKETIDNESRRLKPYINELNIRERRYRASCTSTLG